MPPAWSSPPANKRWPYCILDRQQTPKSTHHEGDWHSRHHVVASKGNVSLPKTLRGYFDTIPWIRRVKGNEFDSVLMQQPLIVDNKEHTERLQRRIESFPFFCPPSPEVRARSRHKQEERRKAQAAIRKRDAEIAHVALLEAAKKCSRPSEKRHTMSQRRKALSGGGMAEFLDQEHLGEFAVWVRSKKMNIVSVWHKLDKDGSMSLTKMEFLTGLNKLRYTGDVNGLWHQFDRDDSGILSFFEFAPDYAVDLAQLKRWTDHKFGSFRNLFKVMDKDNNGKIDMNEFESACIRLGLPQRLLQSMPTLFELVDDPDHAASKGVLTQEELAFLDAWQIPAYLKEKPDTQAADKFKKAVLHKHHGNALTAWKAALDRDLSMKVGLDEFLCACKRLKLQGIAEADPDGGAVPIYCAFDHDRSGWFTLADWDERSHKLIASFVDTIKEQYTKVSDFVRTYECSGNKGLAMSAFVAILRKKGFTKAEASYLFHGLAADTNKKFMLQPADVMFLDQWCPAEEEQQNLAWRRTAATRKSALLLDASDGESSSPDRDSGSSHLDPG